MKQTQPKTKQPKTKPAARKPTRQKTLRRNLLKSIAKQEAKPLEIVATRAKKEPDGRSRYFTPEQKAEVKRKVIQAISTGTPEAVVCRDIAELPSAWTLKAWRDEDEAFASSIAHARLLGHDTIAIDCLRIADDSSKDLITDDDGNERTNSEVIQRSKLRVETRLKLLSKWDPKRYGDRIQAEITGKVITAHLDVSLSPEAASEAYKQLMG